MPKNFSKSRTHSLVLTKALTLGLAGLIAPLASSADGATHNEWSCIAGPNGGWVCNEQTIEGREYPRPQHAEIEKIPDDEGPQVRLARNLDWIEKENMSEEERAQTTSGCCGAYIEPKRDYPDSDMDPNQATLRMAAASTELDQETNTAHLEGNVQLTQGYRQIRSDRATLNQQDRTVDLEGHFQLREPGVLMIGESAHINMDTSAAEINNLSFVVHNAGIRGTAERLTRENDDAVFYVDNATYTTCEPASNTWQLVMSSATINTETGVGVARHTRLEVKGVPVLYVPWFRFPIDDRRVTGLLYPSIAVTEDNGVDFAQPIYLNLAPNYDATITPRYIQERGAMIELEGRHLSASTYTVLSGAFLSDDDGGDDKDEAADFIGEDRWVGGVQHDGGIGHRWSTNIDYTKVSDSDYFRDLGNATLEVNSQTHLRQFATTGYRIDNWDFSVQAKQYQTITDDKPQQYKLLPRVTAQGYYRFGDFVINLANQYTSFDHRDDNVVFIDSELVELKNALKIDDEDTFITGDRLRLDYAATWDKNWSWGYFRPTAKVKHLSYELDSALTGQTNSSPSVTVPVGIIDAGLFAERDTTWMSGFRQTFEPRLYYVHSEFEDQSELPNFDTSDLTFSYNQLFRDDRFTGGDRIGDTERLSVGFTTRIVKSSTGVAWLRASVGQIFYFDDRFVSLNPALTEDFIKNPTPLPPMPSQEELNNFYGAKEQTRDESAYAAELALRLGNNFRFLADALFDEDDGELDKGSVNLHYRDRDNHIFNLGYRYTRMIPRIDGVDTFDADIEQADFSTVLPLFDNWSFIGRWNYDVTNSRELETFVGIEYESCCWRISLLARKWIDRDDSLEIPEDELEEDNGIFLQFQLKGLGGSGSQVDSVFEDGIYGYKRKN